MIIVLGKSEGEKIEQSKVTHPKPASDDTPICKKCGSPIIKRQAKKGENKGEAFYGCTNFPKCREVFEITGK
ncbi:topoisomerase DNA-binding C4 zinc finger domain-containing protein [Aquibacillus sediminis]|uniref:topoisomerase DNA-binding C4 zinc finger domain-containing protein n=1 Tax=Aquibacillus sediminis TaxID=2574734 RepID=UPI001109A0AE|nr:topoisomerase DNA-binding C4 zinc finger domain-containing protein [Aquibacillus sediminis]